LSFLKKRAGRVMRDAGSFPHVPRKSYPLYRGPLLSSARQKREFSKDVLSTFNMIEEKFTKTTFYVISYIADFGTNTQLNYK
jgi:hypothetical protein